MKNISGVRRVFVTGVTGYIGGRLVPRLLERGHQVVCQARCPRKLDHRAWIHHTNVSITRASLDSREQVKDAMAGCETAYYLVHSMMTAGKQYSVVDRVMAANFARAAAEAGVQRIIYLGGLGETGDGLSEHLRSRRDVEETLAAGPVPVTVFRAAMIIGAGSASFEVLRYLVERLPVMVVPRWVKTECQPIAVDDVLRYLVLALESPNTTGRTLDIGGPDILTYAELMQMSARLRGLPRRLILPVPVLSPRLSSLWIHLVTPIPHRIARPLAEGLKNRVVCRNDDVLQLLPGDLLGVEESIRRALTMTAGNDVETAWSAAGPIPGDPDWSGGKVFVDRREMVIPAPATRVWNAVCLVGGGHGWYFADFLWRIRGFLDRLVGGPGLRRGRRDALRVAYGEALDFWRVTGLDAGRRLELRAEMKLPGDAVLEFAVHPETTSAGPAARLVQTARFLPRGLWGLIYWYMVLPLHGFVFRGMMNGIHRESVRSMIGKDERNVR